MICYRDIPKQKQGRSEALMISVNSDIQSEKAQSQETRGSSAESELDKRILLT